MILLCPCPESTIIHLTELARDYILSHVSGLVAGAQCCVINSHKVCHHLGEHRAKNIVLFCACMAPPLWHWAALAGSGSVQSLKIVRKVKKKEEWVKAFNV